MLANNQKSTYPSQNMETDIGQTLDEVSVIPYYDDDDKQQQEYRKEQNNTKTLSRNRTFPVVLYDMLEDAYTLGFEHIVSWLPLGDGLKVHNIEAFENEIMSNYFQNQSKYKSFCRQLNLYGFQRVLKGPFKGCVSHASFRRGKPMWCSSIKRPYKKRLSLDLPEEIPNEVEVCPSKAAQPVDKPTPFGPYFREEIAAEIVATFCRRKPGAVL